MKRTSRLIAITAAMAFALPLTACTGPPAQVRVTGQVGVPNLVYVEPGVWVVADYDRPVFYHDDWYWLYSDGVWLRSRAYDGRFVRVNRAVVPRRVVQIDRPRRYVRYRVRQDARVRRAPPPRSVRQPRYDQNRQNREIRRDDRVNRRDNRVKRRDDRRRDDDRRYRRDDRRDDDDRSNRRERR